MREEVLRPCQYLGYQQYDLAQYLTSRGAPNLAEPLLRRAIYLNPFEPLFVAALAVSLFKQGKLEEAKARIEEALSRRPAAPDFERIQRDIERAINEAG